MGASRECSTPSWTSRTAPRMLTLAAAPEADGSSVPARSVIVAAIRRGDARTARERAKQHRVAARDWLLPLLGQLGMKHL